MSSVLLAKKHADETFHIICQYGKVYCRNDLQSDYNHFIYRCVI